MSEVRSDQKAERLINLTMALLATGRYLTKAEIFDSVQGYADDANNLESMSRKFERDKEDLRQMGIEIEVGSIDPLFDDEQGYRIQRSTYAISFDDISREEYGLISIAISMWRNEFFSEQGQSGLRKIQSLGLDFVDTLMPHNLFVDEAPHESFLFLWSAINEKNVVEFTYKSSTSRLGRVAPYTLTLWHNFWYLTALDLDLNEIRTFKVVRIEDDLRLAHKAPKFEVPQDFKAKEYLLFQEEPEQIQVDFSIASGRALSLRTTSKVTITEGDWDIAVKSYPDYETAIKDILHYGSAVRLDGPAEAKSLLLERLASVTFGEPR